MSDPIKDLGEKIQNEFDEIDAAHQSSKPPEIETDGIFDQDLLNQLDPAFLEEMNSFLSDPMKPLLKILTQSLEAHMPKPLEPMKLEHKVRIFRLPENAIIAEIESTERAIENYLNDGYCCHIPTVVGDYVVMDFSRRKETEKE